jgi:hypothetical protein
MKHIKLFEEFINEKYKTIPYDVKIAGTYKVVVGSQPEMIIRVAGFERQDDDSDSLYLMDDDPARLKFGSFIVKNADMRKLEKGTAVKAKTKEGEVKITRIGNLMKESVSMDAVYIHQVLQTGQNAAQDFIDDNELDGKKLANYVRDNRNNNDGANVKHYISGEKDTVGGVPKLRQAFIKKFKK